MITLKNKIPVNNKLALVIAGLLIVNGISLAQETLTHDTITVTVGDVNGLFDSDAMLNISLRFDVTEYMRRKPEDDYMDAVITIYHSQGDSVSYEIKLRSRGVSRREMCSFPPIRLNFEKTNTIYGDIDSMKNIKVVTHCNTAKVFEDYILKEYLAYRLYNYVTDYSFRVRLLKIYYIDTGKKGRSVTRYGFIIEPVNLLEQRLGVFEVENVPVKYYDLIPDELDRMSIFQFMIGNPDWQILSYHNIKIVKEREKAKAIAIPYDFDYSGFVNASYALPAQALNIDNVRQRVHLGACRPDTTYKRILKEFEANREDFFKEIERCEVLDDKARRYITDYIEGFYKLYKRDRIVHMLRMTCVER